MRRLHTAFFSYPCFAISKAAFSVSKILSHLKNFDLEKFSTLQLICQILYAARVHLYFGADVENCFIIALSHYPFDQVLRQAQDRLHGRFGDGLCVALCVKRLLKVSISPERSSETRAKGLKHPILWQPEQLPTKANNATLTLLQKKLRCVDTSQFLGFPDRFGILDVIIGQPLLFCAIGIHHVNFPIVITISLKGNACSVRRPTGP